MRVNLGLKQKELLGEIFGNLSVALLTIGVIAPFFDKEFPKQVLFSQLIISSILSILLIVSSLAVVKK